MKILVFLIDFLLMVVAQVQGQCPESDSDFCVCIPNVLSQCAESFANVTLEWDAVLGSAVVDLDVVPGSFAQGQGITTLEFSDNPTMMLVNGSFTGLNDLQTLNLRHNNLGSLPDELFSDTPNLQHLDLSNNLLTFVNPLAFRKVNRLQTLKISGNQLSTFPPEEFLPLLQQLTELSLYPNPIDCADLSTVNLLSLVSAGVVTDSSLLRCSNGTLFNVAFPPIIQPTASLLSTSTGQSTVASTQSVTSSSTTPTLNYSSTQVTSSTLAVYSLSTVSSMVVRATGTPQPLYCLAETTFTPSGYFEWPTSLAVSTITLDCPSDGNVGVFRVCGPSGWGAVNSSLCDSNSDIELLLSSITQTQILAMNAVDISFQLSLAVKGLYLSEKLVMAVLGIAEQLINAGANNVLVLNNTLQSLDSILDDTPLSSMNAQQIRSLVDSALLGALSINQTQIVLSYAHLALGGAYLSASNESAVLAVIRLHSATPELELNSTSSGNITVGIEGGSGGVQVTVYEGDDLFNQSNCSNLSATILTPVISVFNKLSDDSEVVTLSFHSRPGTSGHTLLCVRWIALDCGGEWSTDECALLTSSTGILQCRCLHDGSYAVLDVPDDLIEVDIFSTYKIVFHVVMSVSIPFFLVIAVVILSVRHLRSLATLQSTAVLSVMQPLYLVFVQLSVVYPNWLCFTFAMITHYCSLVSLSLLIVTPVLEAIRIFRLILFEKMWLIIPFALTCLIWPSIPIGVYAGLRYSDFPSELIWCWVELETFPNTLTYITVAVALGILLTVLIILVLLACSDYKIEAEVYFRILIVLVNAVLFSGLLTIQFFTGSSSGLTQDQLLIAMAATAFVCGLWHFVSHGILQSQIRTALTCKQDPVLKRKAEDYSRSQPDSGFHSRNSPFRNRNRRNQIKLQEDFSYIDNYLGHPANNPVPLGMLRGDRIQHRKSEQFTSNPLYNNIITLTDDY